MNERLQELARQAGFFANPDVEKFEKFAELIVRECGEIAYKTYWNNPLEVRGVHFKEAMYKRFGIWN